ncbi:MAG TPA: hypothetical protein VIC62_08665, partial [Nakamurella sp.]
MAGEVMSRLRRAVYDGDGPAMVAAVSAAGVGGCLRLVGEVLVGALDWAAVGADDLAGPCVAALRARDWVGDRQPADTLEQTRAGIRSGELVELAVDLEQLADLLDAGPDSGPGRLDLVTGKAWPQPVFEDEWTDEPNDDQTNDAERWLTVWPLGSRAAYRDMADFAATRTDPACRGPDRGVVAGDACRQREEPDGGACHPAGPGRDRRVGSTHLHGHRESRS